MGANGGSSGIGNKSFEDRVNDMDWDDINEEELENYVDSIFVERDAQSIRDLMMALEDLVWSIENEFATDAVAHIIFKNGREVVLRSDEDLPKMPALKVENIAYVFYSDEGMDRTSTGIYHGGTGHGLEFGHKVWEAGFHGKEYGATWDIDIHEQKVREILKTRSLKTIRTRRRK